MTSTRRHDLDWLRVIAFALLILFHVGLLYATWGYNLKSPRLVPAVEPALGVFAAWRMPLLFLISGVACRFLIEKLGAGAFARDRVRRLLPVILFGMFVVIPPQTWIELVSKEVTDQGYLRFWWSSYLPADQTLVAPLGKTMPTWDHLWFLVYLLAYTLLFAAGWVLLRGTRRASVRDLRLPLPVLLVAPALWMAAANVLIATRWPLTHALVDDWGGHLKWLGLFAVGVLCARCQAFWAWLRDRRGVLLTAAALLYLLQLVAEGPAWHVVSGLYGWVAICAVCGFALRYLDRPSPLLSHLNEAVLPVYVLHQPILLLSAYAVFPLKLPLPVEASLLAGVTLLGALAVHEAAIRPFALSRYLFGLKPRTSPPDPGRQALQARG